MQPFAVIPAHPEHHFLSRISDLDNADKHREIATPVMLRRVGRVSWPVGLNFEELVPPIEDNMSPGGEICRYRFETPQSPAELVMEASFGIGLRGAGGAVNSADFILTQLIDNVAIMARGIYAGDVVHGFVIMNGSSVRQQVSP
ncbi:hypothetical protein [Paenarthrobacter sp. PH39-S1]|uniref:hypothetical protein n=1 Tax=Paenarthrobacter sp. PH39-S1 TaxID=3046204 RepID=UPI0024BBAB8E|nr:hypothetical protein [Paenarthrobacter sp. PH39-S1]MDJ0358624.1 hypothetical protein [Paenarthrobacter sp. PH39-S1]